jgi:uncharacterized protein YbjT (DUF2867 family)
MQGYKALVLGASGLVGQSLVAELLKDERYMEVRCLVRKPMPAANFNDPRGKLQPLVINFDELDDYQGYFSVDHVYVCLGTTIKKAKSRSAFRKVDFEYVHAAAQISGLHDVKSFVWISSVGANAHSSSFYLKVKGELENAIFSMSSLEHAFAVRPSLLLGERQESRLAEQCGIAIAQVLSPFLIGKLAKYKPVKAIDVSRKMVSLQVF